MNRFSKYYFYQLICYPDVVFLEQKNNQFRTFLSLKNQFGATNVVIPAFWALVESQKTLYSSSEHALWRCVCTISEFES